MVLLEQLRIHVGGLIRLKGELYWYGGRGWDGCPGRICLLMDSVLTAATPATDPWGNPVFTATPADPWGVGTRAAYEARAATLLLIDGRPHWVWIAPADVELL